jgi:hypothetical protein
MRRATRPWIFIKILLFAGFFSLLFWLTSYREFRRISVIVHKGRAALAEKPLAFEFENPGRTDPGPWILFLKMEGENPSARSMTVISNGTTSGEIELPAGRVKKEFKLVVPGEAFHPGRNRLEVGAGPVGFKLDRILVKNFIGYSKGLIGFIVVPAETPVSRGLPGPIIAAAFLALGILRFARFQGRRRIVEARIETAIAALLAAVFGGALIVSVAGGPRILFSPRTLWTFILLLNAPLVGDLTAAAALKLKPYLHLLRAREIRARPQIELGISLVLAFVALAFSHAFTKSVLRHHNGNYSGFLHIYPEWQEKFGQLYGFSDDETAAALKSLITTIEEYDGQFYYFMAYDPFLSRYRREPDKYLWFIDEPAYRYGRIGYSLLVRIFSWGRPGLYPETMIWILLASYFVGVFFLARILVFFGQSPLWALLYLLVPGFHLSLHFALPEPLAAAFLLAGSYFYLKRKLLPASAFLAASLLVRETGILLVLAFAAFELLKNKNIRATLVLGCALVPLGLWRGFITARLFPVYGWKTLAFSPGDFTLPFLGIADLFKSIFGETYGYPEEVGPVFVYSLLIIAAFAIAAVLVSRSRDVWSLGFFLFSLLSVSLNLEKIWIHPDNAARGTSELFLLLIIAVFARPPGRKPWIKIGLAGFFALVFFFDAFVSRLSSFFLDGLRLF